MSRWTPNRIVALGTGALGTAGAVVALLADLSGPQGAAFAASALVVLGVANRWLVGWQAHERAQGTADRPIGLANVLETVSLLDERLAELADRAPSVNIANRPELSEAEVLEIAEAVAGRLRDVAPPVDPIRGT